MNGTRVYPQRRIDGCWDLMKPGEYGLLEGDWHGCTPNGLSCNLAGHDVVEHVDRTITVSPSIEVNRGNANRSGDYWHGFLERGDWREA